MSLNSQKTYICQKCGYDANSITAIRCELCKHPLELNQISFSHTVSTHRFKLSRRWVVSALALLLFIGGGYLLRRSQPTSNPDVASTIENSGRNTATPLRMVGNAFSGYSTFRSAALREALKSVGISWHYDVKFDEVDFAQQVDLLNQGKADFALATLDQFLLADIQGKIVGLIDRTEGGDAVVLNTKKHPQLKSLQNLSQLVQQQRSRGQQLGIAYAFNSPSEYLALLLNAKFEAFKLSDFQGKEVADAADALRLLQDPSQNVAVAMLWEPYITQARQQGYTVVLSSKDTPGAILDVIIASDRVIQSQPQKISAFLAAYYRLIDTSVSDGSQMRNQIAEDGELSPSDAAAVLQGLEFFTAVEAKNWMADGTLARRINSTSALLTLADRMKQLPQSAKNLFTAKYLEQAASNTQSLINLVRADDPELAERLAGKGKAIAVNPDLKAKQIQTAPDIGNLQAQDKVEFSFNTATLTQQGQKTLDRLAREIAEFNPQTVAVRVIGHTSRRGLADLNQMLSQQRAQAVINYFKQRGLKHKMAAEGKGFSQLMPGISPYDPRNQRTEIRLVRLN